MVRVELAATRPPPDPVAFAPSGVFRFGSKMYNEVTYKLIARTKAEMAPRHAGEDRLDEPGFLR
jgi:hypothetical protein